MSRKSKKKVNGTTSKPVEVKDLKPADNDEGVVKLSEVDALRFGKLDAEVRNHLQGIRIATLEIENLERETAAKIEALKAHRAHIKMLLEAAQPQYKDFIKELAQRYGIPDPARMLIDPETGTVRDTKTDL